MYSTYALKKLYKTILNTHFLLYSTQVVTDQVGRIYLNDERRQENDEDSKIRTAEALHVLHVVLVFTLSQQIDRR